jgi:Caspase domain
MWLLPLAAALTSTAAHAEVVRHAVVVGNNQGGGNLVDLHYAQDDAQRVADLLVELGGFPATRVTLLEAPDPATLLAAIDSHATLAAQQPDDLFLFYYSGHADARGLQLAGEVVTYAALKAHINRLESEVRLGVLDACRSGEITRLKGMEVSAPFAAEDTLATSGEAWLTAASADESAQESDRLQGSFFTHYLLSGLRGAADQNDGVVSLGEAYAYAYDRTVARTGSSSGGTQHPGYDFRLQGEGDLALTDVRRATARLILPRDVVGELQLLHEPTGTPVAELAKSADTEMTVALPPGSYRIVLRRADGVRTARFGLSAGSELVLRDFSDAPVELASNKGDPSALEEQPEARRGTVDELVRQSHDAVGSLTAAGREMVDAGRTEVNDLDLRNNGVVAALASSALPGAGQAYNGQWVKGVAFLVPWASFMGASTASRDLENWQGTLWTGPTKAAMAARMTLGWAAADALQYHRQDAMRPVEGVTLGYGTAWADGAELATTGLSLDWISEPHFSVGLDRSGWFQTPQGVGQANLAARMMFAPWDKGRLRPALLVSGGFVLDTLSKQALIDAGPSAHRVDLHSAAGVGLDLRWYATPRYFLELDARAQIERGEVHGVYGGGLGFHLGN